MWLSEIKNDSLSFFSLLDSLLLFEPQSQLAIRANYNSKIFSSGRDYGISQYGIIGGVSYYHKSGAYADISGQYYSGIEPNFNATNITLGYSSFANLKWSYVVNYSHTFYKQLEDELSIENALNNTIGVSTCYSLKYLMIGVDYQYYFGTENIDGHRITPNLLISPKVKTKGFLNHFKVNPSIYFAFGTETLYQSQYAYLRPGEIEDDQLTLLRIRYRRAEDPRVKDYLRQQIHQRIAELTYTETSTNVFGLLNMLVTLPLQYSTKNFTASINYNINMPFALPGEELDEKTSGYFSLSMLYALTF